jgi:hypothetical protein
MDDSAVSLGLVLTRPALRQMLVTPGMNKIVGAAGTLATARWFERLGLRPTSCRPGSQRQQRLAPMH